MKVGAKVFEVFCEGADQICINRELIEGVPEFERLSTAASDHVRINVSVKFDHEFYFTHFIESDLLQWKHEGMLGDKLREARQIMFSGGVLAPIYK